MKLSKVGEWAAWLVRMEPALGDHLCHFSAQAQWPEGLPSACEPQCLNLARS